MDNAATETETAAVQDLFDEIGFDARVTATYTGKSSGQPIYWVLYVVGSGVAASFMTALGSAVKNFGDAFGKAAGEELGKYAAERAKERLERLRGIRRGEGAVIVRDPSLKIEIVITGEEPAQALEQLKELLETNKLPELPGQAAEVRYRDDQGWVRPF
jgi:hypothetical protein